MQTALEKALALLLSGDKELGTLFGSWVDFWCWDIFDNRVENHVQISVKLGSLASLTVTRLSMPVPMITTPASPFPCRNM